MHPAASFYLQTKILAGLVCEGRKTDHRPAPPLVICFSSHWHTLVDCELTGPNLKNALILHILPLLPLLLQGRN